MIEDPLIFEKNGFPIIKVFEEYFEVKAIGFWDFRTFKYSEVKEFDYYNPNEKWWNIFFNLGGWTTFFDHLEPSIFKIKKNNGSTYEYKCPNEKNKELMELIKLLKSKV